MMQAKGTAYFIQNPRIIEDLSVIHPLDWESPYEVMDLFSISSCIASPPLQIVLVSHGRRFSVPSTITLRPSMDLRISV